MFNKEATDRRNPYCGVYKRQIHQKEFSRGNLMTLSDIVSIRILQKEDGAEATCVIDGKIVCILKSVEFLRFIDCT